MKVERVNDATVRLGEYGVIQTRIDIYGIGLVNEHYYPLCGGTVETEVHSGGQRTVLVQPHTYKRRVFF